MNGEGDEWPVWDAVKGIFVSDARTYLGGWAKDRAAASWDFGFALDKLVSAGCDLVKIAWLLSALANAQGWRRISREHVRDITDDLERAAKGVRRLFFSQLNPLLGLDSLRLAGELSELARRAKELEPHAHERRPMGRDLVRATLVHYVKETTGQFHDDWVAAMISEAESLDQVQGPDAGQPKGYTMEAHVAWRNRDSCKNFLNGPSAAVRELQAAMNDDIGP